MHLVTSCRKPGPETKSALHCLWLILYGYDVVLCMLRPDAKSGVCRSAQMMSSDLS